MKMAKRIVALLLALVMMMGFAACGGESGGNGGSGDGKTKVITFAGWGSLAEKKIFTAMMDTIPKVDDEETYASKMVDYFKDSAVQTLAEQSTEQGGFGLAKTLYEQMKRQYDSSTINV